MAVHAQNGDTLLSYALEPDFLTVSTPSKDSPGELHITVEVKDASVFCQSITIRLPIGEETEDLTADKAVTFSSEETGGGPGGWEGRLRLEDGDSVLAITFTPFLVSRLDSGWKLTMRIAGFKVNQREGSAVIGATERTSPTNGQFEDRSPVPPLRMDKFPDGFFMRNLMPDRIMVENGERVQLDWDTSRGPNTTYRMYWDRESEPVSNTIKWLSPPLERSTGFMLQATVAIGNNRTLTHTLTTAVMVANQDLTTRDVTVHRTLDIGNGPGTATTNLGFTTVPAGALPPVRYLPSNMTDGDRNTYYWSNLHPKTGDWVQIDLGSQRDITDIDLCLGIDTGQYTLPTCTLESSADSTTWTHYDTIPAGRPEYCGTTARTARYLRLTMTNPQAYRIAIRSFDITTTPRGATITPDSATFHTGTVEIVGDLVVTGKVTCMDGVTIPSQKELVVDTIRIPDPQGARKHVVFNAPVWIEDGALPAGTPAHLTVKGSAEVANALKANDGITIPSQKPLVVDTIRIPDPQGARKHVVFNAPVWIEDGALPAGTPAHLTVKGSAEVSGLAVKGPLSAEGPTRILGTPVRIASWDLRGTAKQERFRYQTSGFVIGAGYAKGGRERVRITILIGGQHFTDDVQGNELTSNNTVMVAVAAATEFTIKAEWMYGSTGAGWATANFYWVPIGSGARM